jgi:hypothetical protein
MVVSLMATRVIAATFVIVSLGASEVVCIACGKGKSTDPHDVEKRL